MKLTEDEAPLVVAEDPGRVADGFVGIAASEPSQRITVGALDAAHTHCIYAGAIGGRTCMSSAGCLMLTSR